MRKQLEARTRELAEAREHLAEALEQQTATSEVLQVISSFPGDLEPVFQSVLEKATRICNAQFGNLYLCEGDAFRIVAMHGAAAAYVEARKHNPLVRPPPDSALGRVAITKQRWSRFAGQFGGLAKVDSGFDYAANFSSFACLA